MRIVSRSTLQEFWSVHTDAEDALKAWYQDARAAKWESPNEVKAYASSVSLLSNDRVCFNIKGNKYRLIVSVNYKTATLFVKFLGTHNEYMEIDAPTVQLKGGK